MADELDIDLDQLEADINNKNKIQKIITDLSEKVKITSDERDSLSLRAQQLEVERDNANKERDFYSKFSESSSKYQGANEFKDKIREKVMAGYDVEDATVAVLAKEGKLGSPTAQVAERDTVAGGSATTAMSGTGEKSLHEMSREEKRAALMEDPGALDRALKRG